MAHLVALKGLKPGVRWTLESTRTILGRERTAHVVLDLGDAAKQREAVVSREHAIISCEQEKYFLEDGDGKGKKSRNGTRVNDALVEFPRRILLKNNDIIKICDYAFSFHDGSASDQPSSGISESFAHLSSSINASLSAHSSTFQAQPAEKLKLLLDITNRLSHTLELDSLLPEVVETLMQIFRQADRGFLILHDDATGKLVCRSFQTRHQEAEPQIDFSATIVDRCVKTVEGILSNDAGNQFPESESIAALTIHSAMCAPLWSADGKAFGVLLLDSHSVRKTFTEEDLTLLMGVAGQASVALSNAHFHRAALARERLDRDLALASEVVESFLPAELPEVAGYEFFADYESALEVGGDYYDLITLSDGRVAILVGDVAGKGVSAALVMARFSAHASACLRTEPDLAAAVVRLNALMQPLSQTDRFVTLSAVLLDPATHRLSVVNAGHLPPLLVRERTGQLESVISVEHSGPPLGVMPDYPYEACQAELRPGDRLVLYSDGVTEAVNSKGKQLGTVGLRRILQGASEPAKALGRRVLDAVAKHTAGCVQEDDITLVCVGRVASVEA